MELHIVIEAPAGARIPALFSGVRVVQFAMALPGSLLVNPLKNKGSVAPITGRPRGRVPGSIRTHRWLSPSHRTLDKVRSLLPTHDDKRPLTPGQVYELDVEVWPMCIVLPAGFRIAVNIEATGRPSYHCS
jgi:X-Pro dipeptidyl-peptidase-like protein